MKTWFKCIIFPLYLIFALLPLPILYLFSDLLAFFLRRIVYYRERTIKENLERCFPDLSAAELEHLKNTYYSHLADLIIETIKMARISPAQLMKHCRYDQSTIELLKKYSGSNSAVLVVLGHTGNWEWAGMAFPLFLELPLFSVYRPLQNNNLNALMRWTRSRTGAVPIEMKHTYRSVIERIHTRSATAFLADQSPPRQAACWVPFMDQPTPFFRGVAHIAIKTGLPVIYIGIEKIKRGYYSVHARLVTDEPGKYSEEELTALHAGMLEEDIRQWPACWLWSHRRWKYSKDGQ